MAKTTTAVNACDVSIWLDDVLGTARDISGSSNSFDVTLEQVIAQFTVFGDHWPSTLCCGRSGSITVNVWYTTAANEAVDILKNWYFGADPVPCELRTLSWYIPDKNVGSDYYTTEVRLASASFSPSRDEAGPIAVTLELLPEEISHSVAAT